MHSDNVSSAGARNPRDNAGWEERSPSTKLNNGGTPRGEPSVYRRPLVDWMRRDTHHRLFAGTMREGHVRGHTVRTPDEAC